jgi:hypothetical protein
VQLLVWEEHTSVRSSKYIRCRLDVGCCDKIVLQSLVCWHQFPSEIVRTVRIVLSRVPRKASQQQQANLLLQSISFCFKINKILIDLSYTLSNHMPLTAVGLNSCREFGLFNESKEAILLV